MWFACSTKEVMKLETNATCTDILDLEFDDKIGIQSSFYAGENGDELSKKKVPLPWV